MRAKLKQTFFSVVIFSAIIIISIYTEPKTEETKDIEPVAASDVSEKNKDDGISIKKTDSKQITKKEETAKKTTTNKEKTTKKKQYIFPKSNKKLLTKKQILAISKRKRWIAKNEIYARHGRKFANIELQKYFKSKSWYHGTIEPDKFKEKVFNKIEKKNIKLLVKYEKY